MNHQANDQAEGLRRLLGKQIPKVIAFVSGGARVGKTSAAINLAVAIAQCGRGVLLLDENAGPRNVTATLGIRTETEMIDTVRGTRALEKTLVSGPEGIVILPAARALRTSIDENALGRIVDGFARVCANLDFILVDTAVGASSRLLPLSNSDQKTILIANTGAAAQADALGMIKLMHREFGARFLHLLICMTRSEAEGEATYYNLANVAQRRLGASIELLGATGLDERMAQSARAGRSVVEMFPQAASSMRWRQIAKEIMQWPQERQAKQGMERLVQCLVRQPMALMHA